MPSRLTTCPRPLTNLTDFAYQQLRDQIVHGRLKPKEVISTGQIAKLMGISSMPVRAALTRLETEGLVTILPQKGVIVASISLVEMEELFLIRSRLEALAAFLACTRMTTENLKELQKLLDKMKRFAGSGDNRGWLSTNELWHHRVFQACGNEQLRRLLEDLFRRGMGRRVGTVNVDGHMVRRYAEHAAILDALARKDSDATERLWREHILLGGQEIMRFLREVSQSNGR
ncbi:MAG: GntR family transcriptional regulator [Candidatus Methylomirabilota bacterium]